MNTTDLKAGDEIAVMTGGHRGWSDIGHMDISMIDHVTPTGRVVLINGKKFDKTGREMGDMYHPAQLRTIPQYNTWKIAKDAMAHKNELLVNIDRTEFKHLGIDQLEKIVAIINEKVTE